MTLSQSAPEWPQSPWESLEVLWDSGEEQRLGPWEATLVLDSSDRLKSKHVAPHIPVVYTTKIEEQICALMLEKGDLYGPFEFAVDPAFFADYYSTIPVPMYIDLIRSRLANKFYRQVKN